MRYSRDGGLALRTGRAIAAAVFGLLVVTGTHAQQPSKPNGEVSDFANVVGPRIERQMRVSILEVEELTGAEIRVATVRSIRPYSTVRDYAVSLADLWRVGGAEANGVLVLLAEEERRVYIHVGRGLAIPDAAVQRILTDQILPGVRDAGVGAGLLEGVKGISVEVAAVYGQTLPSHRDDRPERAGRARPDTLPWIGGGVGLDSYTQGAGVPGGTYLTASVASFLHERVQLDLRYATDLVPSTFTNHFAAATLELNVARNVNAEVISTIGPTYLTDLVRPLETQYLGVYVSVLSSGHSLIEESFGMTVDVLALKFLWNLVNGESLLSFTVMDLQFFF